MSHVAVRYSGGATITITHNDVRDTTSAEIVRADGKRIVEPGIRLSKSEKAAISFGDPAPFDKAASAALSFAEADGFVTGAEKTAGAWVVLRKKPAQRIPKVPSGIRRAR